MTRVLVCGGRHYADRDRLFQCLDLLIHVLSPRKISCIIHGAQRGADTLAGEWAKARGIPVEPFPAKWNDYGNAAGSIRNAQMLREGKPDLIVAFDGGPGTANMINKAGDAGVSVIKL